MSRFETLSMLGLKRCLCLGSKRKAVNIYFVVYVIKIQYEQILNISGKYWLVSVSL